MLMDSGGGTDGGGGGGDGDIGDGCMGDGDCMAGMMCYTMVPGFGVALPGGYCTRPCTMPAECGGMGTCLTFGAMGFCARTCSGPEDCRTDEGYSCTMLPVGPMETICAPPFGGFP
jgi:hypothetical protein